MIQYLFIFFVGIGIIGCENDRQKRSVDKNGNCTDEFNREYEKVLELSENLTEQLKTLPEADPTILTIKENLGSSCSHFFGFHHKVSCKSNLLDKQTGQQHLTIIRTTDHSKTCAPFTDI